MPCDLILGTAGHIDHGKTALVKALTGIDCDRLPEEKRRGITIDIGFAHLELDDVRLAIVDVPGHERFIRNMLAGATGIDLGLLVIAADDGIMPQTREHLEIMQLLGLRFGVIALTKSDLVDSPTRELRILEIRDLVQGTFLADAPIISTSTKTMEGIAELKEAIHQLAIHIQLNEASDWFRLCIDRAFTVPGHGTVVTGSIISGRIEVGDELEWLPSATRVRVRSLAMHGRSVDSLHRGQRAALNLPGIPLEAIERGQELATPGYLVPTRMLTASLRVPADVPRPLRHRLELRLHIGTSETMATLSLLDCDAIEPGHEGLGQLFLSHPVCAVWGQPFVLRDSSAQHTLGGGKVLQPLSAKLRRRNVTTIAHIERLQSDDPIVRADMVAWLSKFHGFNPVDLVRDAGVSLVVAEALITEQRFPEFAGTRLHIDRLEEIRGQISDVLDEMHQREPLLATQDRGKLESNLDFIGNRSLVQSVIDRMIVESRLVGDSNRVAKSDFTPKLSVNQRKLKDHIVREYQRSGLQPPEIQQFYTLAGGNRSWVVDLVELSIAEGHLVRISEGMFLHVDIVRELQSRLKDRLVGGKGATVAEIRDWLGTTRKYAVPICEYLDEIKFTRRQGDLRYLA